MSANEKIPVDFITLDDSVNNLNEAELNLRNVRSVIQMMLEFYGFNRPNPVSVKSDEVGDLLCMLVDMVNATENKVSIAHNGLDEVLQNRSHDQQDDTKEDN